MSVSARDGVWKASNGLQCLFPAGSAHTTAAKSVISAMASRGTTRVRSMPQMMTDPAAGLGAHSVAAECQEDPQRDPDA